MLPAGRAQATPPQRARKPAAAPGLRAGSAADRARPDPGAHLPRVGERAGAGVYLSHLPMARGGPAGSALGAYLPPPSPARLSAAADGCFPGYYNNQPATARSGPLRRRPPPGAHNARLRAPTNVVTPAQRGLGDHAQQKNLDFLSPLFLPRP